MRTDRAWAGFNFVLGVLVVAIPLGVCCGASLKPATAEGAFLAEQLDCVDVATSWTEYRQCTGAVRARWAERKDGGGSDASSDSRSTSSDGGDR